MTKGQRKVRDLMMFIISYSEVYSDHINQNCFVYKEPRAKPNYLKQKKGKFISYVTRKLKNTLASGIGGSK